MAKSQKRSSKEIRKPKAAKAKPVVGLSPGEKSPVKLINNSDPKGKH